MAYTVEDRKLSITFRDARNNTRKRTIEISAANIIVDDDITNMHEVSKSTVRSYWEDVKQVDMSKNPDADSEVEDTARLYFLMPNDTQSYFDIVDPKDGLFKSGSGKGANEVIEYGDLNILDGAENSLKFLIDDILNGNILISDGETPHSYLHGVRL